MSRKVHSVKLTNILITCAALTVSFVFLGQYDSVHSCTRFVPIFRAAILSAAVYQCSSWPQPERIETQIHLNHLLMRVQSFSSSNLLMNTLVICLSRATFKLSLCTSDLFLFSLVSGLLYNSGDGGKIICAEKHNSELNIVSLLRQISWLTIYFNVNYTSSAFPLLVILIEFTCG